MTTFFEKYRTQISINQILGILDRMIQARLQALEWWELQDVSSQLMKRAKVIAQGADGPTKIVTLGRLKYYYLEHPLQKYLAREYIRRDFEDEKRNPNWRGETEGMTSEQVRQYLIDRAERRHQPPKGSRSLPVLNKR